MISRKTKYALKALMYLARESDRGPVLISEISEEERIPKKFLESILVTLKNQGFLHSRKGKGGGYSLGKPPKEIIVGEVVRLLDGPFAPVPCVSETAYMKCTECNDENACGIRLVMKDVRDAIAGVLLSTTLADMIERVKETGKRNSGISHPKRGATNV
ncbi:MAG TPA: Rrf2 family transcriptional regulator [Nitrospirota bacterium]|jgi:Rrf2 family protein